MRSAEWKNAQRVFCYGYKKKIATAEANDPELRSLKDRINELAESVRCASDKESPELLKAQNEAIQALVDHIASKN